MYLTVQQLSLCLNVKESWIRQQVFARKIPFKKLNRLVRFDKAEIEKWIDEQNGNKSLLENEKKEVENVKSRRD